MENAPLAVGAHLRRRQDRPAQGPFSTAAQHPPQKGIFSREGGASKAPGTFPAVAPATCHHPHPYSGARPAGRGTPGRPLKASSEGAALSNTDPTCSGRPLAPAPRPTPQATERAARSRHSGGHRPRHRAPNSGRTLISPQGTSRWGGGGGQGRRRECGAVPRWPGTRPPSRSRWRAPPARPRRPRKVRGPPVGCGTPAGPGMGVPAPRRPRRLPPAAATPRTVRAPPRPRRTPRTPTPTRPEALRGGRSPEGGGGAGAGDGVRLPSADPRDAGAVGVGRGLAGGGGGRTARVAVPRGPGRPGEMGRGPPRAPAGAAGGWARRPERTGGEQQRGPELGAPGERGGREAGLETASRGPARPGAQPRPGRGRRGEARTHLGVESGGAGVGVHVPGGWVGGGGWGSAEAGVRERARRALRAGGLWHRAGRGRTRPGRGRPGWR